MPPTEATVKSSALVVVTEHANYDAVVSRLNFIDRAMAERISYDVLAARLDGVDQATKVFQENLTRVPTEVDRRVTQIDLLFQARLDAHTARVDGMYRELTTKLDDIDKATVLLREITATTLSSSDRGLANLEKVMMEKFKSVDQVMVERFGSVDTQFKERDTRMEQSTIQTKTAVDAALQAAEKAVGKQQESNSQAIQKSETNTTKQIEQITATIAMSDRSMLTRIEDIKTSIVTADKATGGKVEDVKQRVTTLESVALGRKDQVSGQSNTLTIVIAAAVLLVMMFGIAVTMIFELTRKG